MTCTIQTVLFAGYVLCFAVLNAVALLVSLFFRKKFKRSSPRGGFSAAIICALMYCVFLCGGYHDSDVLWGAAKVALAGSACASLISITTLFFIMRKVRK